MTSSGVVPNDRTRIGRNLYCRKWIAVRVVCHAHQAIQHPDADAVGTLEIVTFEQVITTSGIFLLTRKKWTRIPTPAFMACSSCVTICDAKGA